MPKFERREEAMIGKGTCLNWVLASSFVLTFVAGEVAAVLGCVLNEGGVGKDVSSTIQASIGPCRSIAGITFSRTLTNTGLSAHGALATKCSNF
jgi:hypothetical protein